MTTSIQKTFTSIGGEFLLPIKEISEKLKNIKLFVFDWDGVFNAGIKAEGFTGYFSEPDSMGINLLRFSAFLIHKEEMLKIGIITGMNNHSAQFFAEREHLDFIKKGAKNKITALNEIINKYNIEISQVAFIFDDVLDISIAKECGLRFLVRRNANPLFLKYAKENKYYDYLTANQGNENAIREITELLMGLYGNFNQVMKNRIDFSEKYQKYWNKRNSIINLLVQ